MPLIAFQSPLSILGLKYAEHNRDAIKKAYKRAALHCHPDKNHNPVIPTTYYNLLKEAHDWLLVRGDSIVQFKGYPVVFFPRRDNAGQPSVFKIPISSQFTVCECGEIPAESSTQCDTPGCEQSIQQDFTVCNACKTPIPVHGYDVHISEHGLCSICGKVPDEDHYQVSHPETICLLCDAVNLNGHIESHAIDSCSTCRDKLNEGDDFVLVDHIREDHLACPLCKQECGDNFREHLYKAHHFEWDESCFDCCDEVLSHYLSSHQWLRCPYPECELHIAQGKLWKHAKTKHHFRRCLACPRTEEGFSKDRIHAQAHEIANCPVCMESFHSCELPHHQVYKHCWLLCTYCNRAEESEEMLQVHVKEDHRLADCSICQQQHLEEKIDIHLSEDHGWMKCSWCNKAFTEEELRMHITESHPLQAFCACGYKDTIPNLKLHRMHTHAWQQCPYCENIEPPDQFEQHIDEHQLMTCQECDISFLPEKERAHFQEKHQCFCKHFDSPVDMSDHIPRHLDQSRLPSPAPNSDLPKLSAKFQGIPGQSQGEESVRRDQVGKRKRSHRKCDHCRNRKIKVRTNSLNVYDQY